MKELLDDNMKNDDFFTNENAHISDGEDIDMINNITVNEIKIKKIMNDKFKLFKV